MKELESLLARLDVPVVPVVYYIVCPGCDEPHLEKDSHKGFCSFRCFCETSSIDREDG